MSRIGKKPINIPEKVEIKIENDRIIVKGPKGELSQPLPDRIKAVIEDSEQGKILKIAPEKKNKEIAALWGLSRALVFNMIKGVTEGFEKQLQIEGVGFRAVVQGSKLVLSLGLSHPVEMEAPKGIEFKVEKNIITISGIDKQLVGQVAAKIRDFKKPEPYKGKGIRYVGEVIRRKAGKKAAGAE